MGITKAKVTGCFDARDWQHILTVSQSEWPNLTTSASLRRIVREHRAWYESGQRLLCKPRATAEESLGIEKQVFSEPRRAEGMKTFAQERKRA